MGRVVRSVSLPPEMDQIVEKNIDDFSEYVRGCLDKDFRTKDQINKKIKEYETKIKELKKLKCVQINKNISKEETEFLEWAKENKKNNPGELLENCRVYNLKFRKRISEDKFRKLIE